VGKEARRLRLRGEVPNREWPATATQSIGSPTSIIELIPARDDKAAPALMERHILSALEDILRFGISKPDESPEDAPRDLPDVILAQPEPGEAQLDRATARP
jgi:hypothetical protein